jgi:hypothetical protein
MEVAMMTWLFIGTIFGAMSVLALVLGRSRSVLRRNSHGVDREEDRRRKDVMAEDSERIADARTPPYQGGYPL